MKSKQVLRERGVKVAWTRIPFDVAAPRKRFFPVPHGERAPTIRQMIDAIPEADRPLRFDRGGVVCVDSQPVPRELWGQVRPKIVGQEVGVTLHVPPREGDQIFLIVAAVALLLLTAFIGAGSLGLLGASFAAGTFGAQALAAGVGLLGALAIGALSKPPALPNVDPNTANDARDPASLDNNVLQKGGTIPRVIGTRRLFPPAIAQPYIELVGKDEYVEAVFALSGPHALSELRAGAVPIEETADFQIEVKEGWSTDTPITLVTRQSFTEQPQQVLSPHNIDTSVAAGTNQNLLKHQNTPDDDLPGYHSFYTRAECDRVVMILQLPEGLVDANAPTVALGVPFRMRVRPKGGGDSDWIYFPEFHVRSKATSPIQFAVEMVWDEFYTDGLEPTPQALEAICAAFLHVPGQVAGTYSIGASDGALATSDYDADSYFSDGAGDSYLNNTNRGASKLRYLHMTEDRIKFFMGESGSPVEPGTLEIQIKRGTVYLQSSLVDSTYLYASRALDFFSYVGLVVSKFGIPKEINGIRHKCAIARVSSIWNEHPTPRTGDALIAIKAKNRQVGQLSVLASGYVPDWNETTQQWDGWTTTSNPAPHYRDVLGGELNARRVPKDMISDANLLTWRERCADEGYTADLVCDGRSAADVLDILAGCGYARPRQSEVWGVVIDKDRSGDGIEQSFTPLNSQGLTIKKGFPDRPDGLRVKFFDVSDDYREGESTVLRHGVDALEASRFEAISYPATVHQDQTDARAEFDQRYPDERPVFYELEVGWDAIKTTRGDVVGVQSDMLDRFGGFARIKSVVRDTEGDVVQIVLDDEVPFPAGGDYFSGSDTYFSSTDTYFAEPRLGVSIRRAGAGVHVTAEVEAFTDTTGAGDRRTVLNLLTALSDPSALVEAGCLVTTGLLGSENRRLILFGITPRSDMKASIVLVDEGNALFHELDADVRITEAGETRITESDDIRVLG